MSTRQMDGSVVTERVPLIRLMNRFVVYRIRIIGDSFAASEGTAPYGAPLIPQFRSSASVRCSFDGPSAVIDNYEFVFISCHIVCVARYPSFSLSLIFSFFILVARCVGDP